MMSDDKNSLVILDENKINSIQTVDGVKDFLIDIVGEENVKIKPADGQMIFHHSDYYYKFVVTTLRNQFQNIIRQTLAEIYREDYGLHWEVFEKPYNDGLSIVQIIEKETVTVCEDKTDQELADALGEIIFKIEQRLGGFDFILDRLKHYMNNFSLNYKIKLMKLSQIKNADYGITKDGRIILLDDSDWYLVIYDQSTKNIVVTNFPIFIVNFRGEEYFFTSIHDMDDFDAILSEAYAPDYRFNLVKVNQFIDPRDIQHCLQDKILFYYNGLANHIEKEQILLEKQEKLKQLGKADEDN